jgi:hypothetical protein
MDFSLQYDIHAENRSKTCVHISVHDIHAKEDGSSVQASCVYLLQFCPVYAQNALVSL